jgi:two-component system, NtrC family, sensor kinase
MAKGADFESFYRVLMDVSSSVHFYSEVKHVLDILANKAVEALGAQGALIRIYNVESHQLELGAACGLSDRFFSKRFAAIGRTADQGLPGDKVTIIRHVLDDPRVDAPQEAWAEGIRLIVDAPLVLRSDTLGAIRIYFGEQREFSKEELDFVALLAEIGATLIERDRLIEVEKSRYDKLAVQTEKLSALGRMAAGIAHEINNPLGGIMLYSSNLLKKVPGEGSVKEGLEIILQEAIRCKTIIQELLEFSRESEPLMVLTDVAEVVEKARHILENEFRLRHIRVEQVLRRDLPKVCMDVSQIEQVLVNLFLNAVQAIEEEGTITVRTFQGAEEKTVCIEVSDTGCGIAREHVDKIFEPFFSTKPKGTGLGLAVTYGILQKHGGVIHVTSDPGRGSTFIVELPIPEGQSSGCR